MTFWEKRASERMPNAFAAGRVSGVGPYALLSCRDDGSRWVTLFEDMAVRNRAMWKWDRNGTCGVEGCNEDHRMIDIGNSDETANFKTDTERDGLTAVHNSR